MVRLTIPVALWFAIGCGGSEPSHEVDAAPAVVERATVFLAFDGVTLQPGAEDATANTTGFVDAAHAVQPFHAAAADRATQITAVTASVRSILAPFDLELVTARPATGPYDMIVFGDTAADVGLAPEVGALAAIDCDDHVPSGIVVLFADAGGTTTPAILASTAVVALGITNGIPTSTVDNDCMCWGGNGCRMTGACTIGGANTAVAPNNQCAGGAATMDEHARFAAAFGLAP